ncbi:MAG: hypothetical protein KIT69_04890 [Propionibacteriaceae bacterium]|nr:hypothetical protein [Propionibacteriaceae bacterium]
MEQRLRCAATPSRSTAPSTLDVEETCPRPFVVHLGDRLIDVTLIDHEDLAQAPNRARRRDPLLRRDDIARPARRDPLRRPPPRPATAAATPATVHSAIRQDPDGTPSPLRCPG